MDLPKRFREKPRKQDVYSKRDWDSHPSHAPPYGFCQDRTSLSGGAPEQRRESGSAGADEARKQTPTAFIGVPSPYSSTATASMPRCRLQRPAACRTLRVGYDSGWRYGMALTRAPGRAAAWLRASAADDGRADRSVGKGVGGAKGFGKASGPGGKAKESGFSAAKKERPDEYPQMQAVFTCNRCETRQSKIFTRMAYESGVVVVKCEGCAAQHIMADNLGYFEDMTGERAVNVEDLLRAKGEKVDNRLSDTGVGKIKLADPVERDDGTLEVRPDSP